MAYESEVRQVQRKLSNASDDVSSANRGTNSLIASGGKYWLGDSANAFKQEYSEISSTITRLLSYVNQAEADLGRLKSLIARAERERRQNAESN